MSETCCKCDKNLNRNSKDKVNNTCVYEDPVFLRWGWEGTSNVGNSKVENVEEYNTNELIKNVYEDPIFLKVGWD